MIVALRNLAGNESGGALIEYALVLSLVSMVAFVTLLGFGDVLESFFASSSQNLSNVALLAQ
jgi:Flp pilus assembly pilin Flp